jgi:accessory colonization factor AcfC
MRRKSCLAIFFWTVAILGFHWEGSTYAQEKALRIYGPEGPSLPMKECAEIFSKKYGIKAEVLAGPEPAWVARAKEDADVIYEGAEYRLTLFIANHSCLVDEGTRTSLYPRVGGILVRKGNPKKVGSLADLAQDRMRLLVVNGSDQVGLWEDIAGVRGLIPDLQKRITVTASTSAEAVERWKTMMTLDAWITFESWHYPLKDITDLVQLPREGRIYRGTSVIATNFYKNKEPARKFIDFLKTEECHAVFQKWGWE